MVSGPGRWRVLQRLGFFMRGFRKIGLDILRESMYALAMTTTPTIPSTEFTVHGTAYEIKPGDVVEKDGRISERLHPGDNFADSGYPGCQFRLPVWGGGPIKSVAVNIKVTGRSWQWRDGKPWIRVRIEFVGDCAESTFASGWLLSPTITQDRDSWYAKNPVKPLP